jgi:hypothetical protein
LKTLRKAKEGESGEIPSAVWDYLDERSDGLSVSEAPFAIKPSELEIASGDRGKNDDNVGSDVSMGSDNQNPVEARHLEIASGDGQKNDGNLGSDVSMGSDDQEHEQNETEEEEHEYAVVDAEMGDSGPSGPGDAFEGLLEAIVAADQILTRIPDDDTDLQRREADTAVVGESVDQCDQRRTATIEEWMAGIE